MALLFIEAGRDFAGRVYNGERRGYWSSAFPLMLEKHGHMSVEVAGPDACSLDTFAREYMAAKGDKRQLVADVHARYFGAELDDTSLMPGGHPRFGSTSFEDWLGLPARPA